MVGATVPGLDRRSFAVPVRDDADVEEQSVHEGIAKAGASAEARYCQLTGATRAERRADGDAKLDGCLVEIKKTSGKDVNLNQVRPWKYLPLVVYRADYDEWYVIGAHRVVAAASTKQSQHCTSPFECVKLNLSKEFLDCRVGDPSDLAQATRDAIAAAAARSDLEAAMRRMRTEYVAAANQARAEIQRLLGP